MFNSLYFEYSCGVTLTAQGGFFAHKAQDVGGFPFLMQPPNGQPPSKFRHMAPVPPYAAPTLVKMAFGKVVNIL